MKTRERRQAERRCADCNIPLLVSDAYYCKVCRKIQANKSRVRREERVKTQKCADCGQPIDISAVVYRCLVCTEKRRKTKEQIDAITIYDALCKLVKEPAVLKLGDRFIVGIWIPTAELDETSNVILKGKPKAVQIYYEGTSWEDVKQYLDKRSIL